MSKPSSLSASRCERQDQEELAGYLLGDLLPEQASALEARLAQDPELAAELQALHETLHLLPYGLPGVIPPPSLRDKVMAEVGIREVPTRWQLALPSLGSGDFKAGWRWLGGFLAVAMILLVFDNWRLRQALQLVMPTARLRERLESLQVLPHLLQEPGSRLVNLQGEAGWVKVLFHPGDWQEMILAATGLPQLAAGERYHLWLRLDSGELLYLGDFQVDEQGSALVALHPLRTPPAGGRPLEMWITAQAPALPREPRGAVLLTGKVSQGEG